MRKYITPFIVLLFISFNKINSQTVAPGGVSNDLKLWLKTTKGLNSGDGEKISLWENQGIGSNAIVNEVGQEPTYRNHPDFNVNFNPVIDFDNGYNPVDENYSLNSVSTQYLKGNEGFYTQDIFIILIPDLEINSTFGSMDIFCGDENIAINNNDLTGIGLGSYTSRFDNEIISYAKGTSSLGNGYGVSQINSTISYENVGIINTRNNINSTNQELYYNGQNIGTHENDLANFTNVNNSRFWIGRSEAWDASLNARIAEIITYSSRKNDTSERAKIESYLGIKYGITLGEGKEANKNYVDSDNVVIWDKDLNINFNYDVAGIGRDDVSDLNQKQSKSVNLNSLITIGLGSIERTNLDNTNTFIGDKSYLVWGNNNEAFNTNTEIYKTLNLNEFTTNFTTVSKKWKIVESNNDVGEVIISLPTSELTTNIPLAINEKYMLIVSSDANFDNNSIIDIIPLVENGLNYETWYDFDSVNYFTIAKSNITEIKRSIDFSNNSFLVGNKTLELTNEFTVSAWVQNKGLGGSFISKGTGFNFKIFNGKVNVFWNDDLKIISNNELDNKWHNITLTYSSNIAKLYIDGILDNTVTSLANPIVSENRFTVGGYYLDKNNVTYFDGLIDEIRFLNTALSETELRFIMNQEIIESDSKISGVILNESISKNDIENILWNNLTAYYDLNSFIGSSVVEKTNDNNNLRINYLLQNKNITSEQTAPLPYKSSINGNWDDASTWLNNSSQYLPNTTLNGINVNWNIVEINNTVSIDKFSIRNKECKVLGLIVNDSLIINGSNDLNSGNGLTVTHYLKLDGKIDLEGDSQLIQTIDSDLVIGINGSIERDQQGEGNKYRYNYLSSPVVSDFNLKTFTVRNVLKDGSDFSNPIDIDFVSGYDGSSISSPIKIASYWIYAYRNLIENSYSSWQQIGSTTSLKAAEGFTMKGTGAISEQNYVFQGKPNNGTITLILNDDNQYLVGNPYPSSLDADQFIADNSASIKGTIHFWEHYGGDSHNLRDYEGGYASYNYSGGVGISIAASPNSEVNQTIPISPKIPGRYIPIGQGFFVDGNITSGTKNIIFKNSQRVFQKEEISNSVFMKTTKSSNKNLNKNTDLRKKIRLGFETEGKAHRQLLLTFDERASDDVDWGFDGEVYSLYSNDMFWLINNEKYIIQATNKINLDKEIPLGIKITENGNVKIMIDALENLNENTLIFIKDKLTGDTYDITNKEFNVNLEIGEYFDRFLLAFQPRLKTLEEINLIDGITIIMNNNSNELQITRIVDTQINSITMYNMLGQNVNTWSKNISQRLISIPINITPGVYIINIETTNGLISKKIIVN